MRAPGVKHSPCLPLRAAVCGARGPLRAGVVRLTVGGGGRAGACTRAAPWPPGPTCSFQETPGQGARVLCARGRQQMLGPSKPFNLEVPPQPRCSLRVVGRRPRPWKRSACICTCCPPAPASRPLLSVATPLPCVPPQPPPPEDTRPCSPGVGGGLGACVQGRAGGAGPRAALLGATVGGPRSPGDTHGLPREAPVSAVLGAAGGLGPGPLSLSLATTPPCRPRRWRWPPPQAVVGQGKTGVQSQKECRGCLARCRAGPGAWPSVAALRLVRVSPVCGHISPPAGGAAARGRCGPGRGRPSSASPPPPHPAEAPSRGRAGFWGRCCSGRARV